MLPVALAFMAVGSIMQGASKSKADKDRADAERQNAGFYREEADYAKFAGDREIMLFDRQAKVTYGEQRSAFAKAGVDTSESSRFLAEQMLYGDQEHNAMAKERDMNVRLATLKADQAETQAFNYDSAAQWDMFSGFLGAGGSVAEGASGSGLKMNSGLGGAGGSGIGIWNKG